MNKIIVSTVCALCVSFIMADLSYAQEGQGESGRNFRTLSQNASMNVKERPKNGTTAEPRYRLMPNSTTHGTWQGKGRPNKSKASNKSPKETRQN